ncbi:MAG: hypothetical protein KDK97_06610 [Verrucomicrobiales bacterium]|nr:hypothetical protein [Verrucomicrobiales bacterium]MCP5560233.1 hypothetical protein [Verrucomicrobiaceae bacterium]
MNRCVRLILVLCLSATIGGRAQTTPSLASVALRKAFTDTDVWRSADFAGLFRLEEGDRQSPVARVWLKDSVPLGTLRYQSISARLIGGRIQSVTVVILDAGDFFGYRGVNLPGGMSAEAATAAFEAEYAKRRVDWINFLQDLGMASLGEVYPGEKEDFHWRAQAFQHGKVYSRLSSFPRQGLILDLFPSRALASSVLCTLTPKSSSSAGPDYQSRVAALENGDHRIDSIPMLAQGNRGYCGVAVLAMAGQYLGLQPGAEECAALTGMVYGQVQESDPRELMESMAKAAGLKAERVGAFDMRRAIASINQGLPVIVFRRWSQERDYIHTLHTKRLAKGEDSELPVAGIEDRRSWPGKDALAHASIMNGYHAGRGEVILTESWGQEARNRRMRWEELEGTAYYVIYLTR